jgi:hypothetical protein
MNDTVSHKKKTECSVLDVIAVISNPVRYDTRYRLFNEFCKRMAAEPTVRLTTLELQQKNRPFATDATIKLRSDHEIWYKENLINIAVTYLPADWEYMAWIDADIKFLNEKWARETIEQLQTYKLVQLWSHAIDLGPNEVTLNVHRSFMYMYAQGKGYNSQYGYWHPGYAWACRRSTYNNLGRLMDFAIVGSGDHHMALCFVGLGDKCIPQQFRDKINKNYHELIRIFQLKCDKYLKKDVGYVPGTICHYFHGDKKNRKYFERWEILTENDYDPLIDIKYNDVGLLLLEDCKPDLRDSLRKYFRGRNEDSIDLLQKYPHMP